jgi:guanosine-3',5'-bis(diphosphate) 3'-pyrophosphohydrolase
LIASCIEPMARGIMRTDWMTPRLEKAMRWSALCHLGQTRKGSDIPYFEHAAAVALILDRAGFDEDVVIAGLLHDVVEDTAATLEDVSARFGPDVREIVRGCSEIKLDAEGRKRPWIDRKRDHLAALVGASATVWAIILADKLHNLTCIDFDLEERQPVWSQFNAERSQVLWYYRATIDASPREDLRIVTLAAACRTVLARIESRGEVATGVW